VLYQVYFINHQIIIIKNELMEIIDLYDLNLNYFSLNQFTLNHLMYINNHYPFFKLISSKLKKKIINNPKT
jgi:hypothetical protein